MSKQRHKKCKVWGPNRNKTIKIQHTSDKKQKYWQYLIISSLYFLCYYLLNNMIVFLSLVDPFRFVSMLRLYTESAYYNTQWSCCYPPQVLAVQTRAGGPLLFQWKLSLLLFQPWNSREEHTINIAATRLLCQQRHVAAFCHGKVFCTHCLVGRM